MRPAALIPAAVFLALLGLLGYRLVLVEQGDAPSMIPSALIDKPMPGFALPPAVAAKPGVASADLAGRVVLINFFASWCVPCRAEHPLLARLAAVEGLTLAGIDYKDKPEDAAAFLARQGDPYAAIGADRSGRVGIDFGVYGVPESYLVDRSGRIRYKQVGPLTAADIDNRIIPLVAELRR